MDSNKIKRMVAYSLSFLMFQSSAVSINTPAYAEESIDEIVTEENMQFSDEQFALDALPEKLHSILQFECNNAISLDENTYYDLYSIGTINDDGTKSLMTFNSPVKYYDENGCIHFIDNHIIPTEDANGVAYVNEGNSYNVTFPESIDSGISLTCGDFSLSMMPVAQDNANKVQLFDNEIVYSHVFDELTDVRYALDDFGIKESIVVSEANGKSTYDFTFNAEGLIPENKEGTTITFISEETGEVAYIIQPTYIIDSYVYDVLIGKKEK